MFIINNKLYLQCLKNERLLMFTTSYFQSGPILYLYINCSNFQLFNPIWKNLILGYKLSPKKNSCYIKSDNLIWSEYIAWKTLQSIKTFIFWYYSTSYKRKLYCWCIISDVKMRLTFGTYAHSCSLLFKNKS